MKGIAFVVFLLVWLLVTFTGVTDGQTYQVFTIHAVSLNPDNTIRLYRLVGGASLGVLPATGITSLLVDYPSNPYIFLHP